MGPRHLYFGLLMVIAIPAIVMAQGTRLLRHPTVSREQVAFPYAGDLWLVSREGGQARRLTSTAGSEMDPYFSPDGSQVAFSATVAGNTDVYVMKTAGGDAKRLTYHPGPDRIRGWTPDGRQVVFASGRISAPQPYFRLWTIGLDAGLPNPLPMPRAFSGVYSPDGSRFAHEEFSTAFIPVWHEASQWRHYRGGRTHPIRVMTLSDHSIEKLPWTNSNDTNPMWIGNTIYFLSDRNHTVNLFSYRTDTKQITQLTRHDDFDVMNASAGPDAIVYEQAGYVHLLDARTGQTRKLNIEVSGDLPWARPQFKKVVNMIRNSALSPTGVRAAFEARGEIFSVPAEKGDYRNLTQSPGAHDRSPTWSPDGAQLAWLSDASGEYQLMLGDPLGVAKPRTIPLPSTAFFSAPQWSPDGMQILLQDNHRNLWLIEVASGKATKIDTDSYPDPIRSFDATWAPDSKWIAYSKNLPSRLRAIFIHSLAEKKSYQITDGLADSISPAFDAGGKYLYFMASTNYGPSTGWLEMSSIDRPVRRAIYLAVLGASEPSPLLPDTGDEPPPRPTPAETQAQPQPTPAAPRTVNVRVDFDRIGQRIISVNIPAGDYSNLTAGAAGSFYYTEPIQTTAATPGPPSLPPATGQAFDSYISDPANPVPYRLRPIELRVGWSTWLVEDQRFVDHRPDVLSWVSEPLTEDVVVSGRIVANLFASTTGTDSDWIVKLIDKYPERYEPDAKMGGYQLMIAGDVFRGRYLKSFEKPQLIPANSVQQYQIPFPANDHTFRKGHRIMVQVQSSWFPVIDRNPQRFVPNIFLAKESDFQQATQRVFRSGRHASYIAVPVEERTRP